MLTQIDWISASFACGSLEGMTFSGMIDRLKFYVQSQFSLDLVGQFFPELTLSDKGRAPYKFSLRNVSNSFVIFFGEQLPHALIEISEQGCEFLRQHETLEIVLQAVQSRLTRIDIATDILTDVRPLDFVKDREKGHFRTHSEFISESGETCYIGSRTSNRYARVYRYNDPHERAHLLRIEYVLKAEDAKATVETLLQTSPAATAKALGSAFGWFHPVYQPDASETPELTVFRPERHEGKTLYWLADTIAPLLIRLHREGIIDATAWLQDNVVSKLPPAEL